AEAATGKPFARYWMHNGMLMIRGEEMHKSLGNFVTLEQAFERWDPMVIRFFILLTHYRNPLDLTEEALDAAERGYGRLAAAMRAVRQRMAEAPEGEADAAALEMVDRGRQAFEESMNDDFNTPGGIAALFDMTREVNTLLNSGAPLTRGTLEAIDTAYRRMAGEALGLLPDNLGEEEDVAGLSNELIELLIETRLNLRKAKQWQAADEIRDRLAELGIQLHDSAEGTTWSRSN
ncbi:MAG TPA: cysteine--tRNA ligase, partial [Chloroflexi bacterium]|nr:cysteine--tRNA ligase [Chloroflexota bacterium]